MMGDEMNDTQILTIALSTAPTMLLVLVGILINNARLGDLSNFNSRFNDLNTRIGETNARIAKPILELVNSARTWTCALRK